jgi:hypothetical protein
MSYELELPPGVCTACFNEQQRFSFPFLVYCRHGRTLALVENRHKHATFECEPGRLNLVVDRLKNTRADLRE